MFRNTFTRALKPVSVSCKGLYSTQAQISKDQIAQLLERVQKITAQSAIQSAEQGSFGGNKLRKSNRKPYNNKRSQKNGVAAAGAATDAASSEAFKPGPKKPFQQRTSTRDTTVTSDFSDVASGFVASNTNKPSNSTQRKTFTNRNNNYANKNNAGERRGSRFTDKLRDVSASSATAPAPRQRAQRRQRGSTPRDEKKSSGSSKISFKKANPNTSMISTSYVPEVPSIDELIIDSPLTSQSADSRILKAYRELKHNPEADVSGVLTGKFHVASGADLDSKLKTDALKKNAAVVVSSLNKNTTLDYETKMKLLMPLSGLAPVKQLSA